MPEERVIISTFRNARLFPSRVFPSPWVESPRKPNKKSIGFRQSYIRFFKGRKANAVLNRARLRTLKLLTAAENSRRKRVELHIWKRQVLPLKSFSNSVGS